MEFMKIGTNNLRCVIMKLPGYLIKGRDHIKKCKEERNRRKN